MSGGGKAGRQRRGGQQQAALREPRGGKTAARAADRPQWECCWCQTDNWVSRTSCRYCCLPRAPGALKLQRTAPSAAATPLQPPLPATGANAVPLGQVRGAVASRPSPAPAAGQAAQTATAAAAEAQASAADRGAAAAPTARPPPQQPNAGGGAAAGAPRAVLAMAAEATSQAERAQAAAVRAAETKRLASLDDALAALAEDDVEAVAALRKARAQCAARIADTQPLGKRLAAARRAHTRAAADLARAEEAARAAAQRAQAALETEHRLAAQVQDLEGQVMALQGRQPPEPALQQARSFLAGMDAWLADLGLTPPAELRDSAAILRETLPQVHDLSPEYSPTELGLSLSPTLEEEECEEMVPQEDEEEGDAGMRPKREAEEAVAPGPAVRPRREVDSGPYARLQQRAASH